MIYQIIDFYLDKAVLPNSVAQASALGVDFTQQMYGLACRELVSKATVGSKVKGQWKGSLVEVFHGEGNPNGMS